MNKNSKIYIAGHTGLVGSAIMRNLQSKGYENIIYASFSECDLRDSKQVEDFFKKNKPEYVFLAAAKVGGIIANNNYRAEFIIDNLQIQNNIIGQCHKNKVKKLLFLGSSCIYSKNCPQPMQEHHLLTDVLEYTNEPYAIAKIAGIRTIESFNIQYGTNFLSVMPTNLYGKNDNFDLEKSHVLPALIRKMHIGKCLISNDFEAVRKDLNKNPIQGITGNFERSEIIKILNKYGIFEDRITLWGTGKPKREFLHSDDLADACVYLTEKLDFGDILKSDYNITEPKFPITDTQIRNTHINIGTGKDISIKELAELIKTEIVNYDGEIVWDSSKPDGTLRKLLDVGKLERYGWKYKTELKDGLSKVYGNYTEASSI